MQTDDPYGPIFAVLFEANQHLCRKYIIITDRDSIVHMAGGRQAHCKKNLHSQFSKELIQSRIPSEIMYSSIRRDHPIPALFRHEYRLNIITYQYLFNVR